MRQRALVTICAVLFLTFLDTTIVSVALASIQTSLHAGIAQLQWIVNGYALTFASLMLAFGSLSDRVGRRRVIVAGLACFCLGSVIAIFAIDPTMLIVGRVVMGVGAAASEPGTLSIIRHLYPKRAERARALGIWAAVSGLALALGPVIGGVLVGIATWRAVFVFNLLVGISLIVATTRNVPESRDPGADRFDRLGFVAVSCGLGALTFAVISGETYGYGARGVVALFVIGLGALFVFVLIERRSRSPLIDLSYMASAPFSGALVFAFLVFFGIFSIFFFTALYLQVVVGYSGYRSAIEFIPMAAALIAAALITGRLVARLGPRWPMTFGALLAGIGLLASDAILSASNTPSIWLIATLAVAGLGFGAGVVPMASVTLGLVPPEHSGMASSATNTSRELGAVFGVAVLGALVNGHLTTSLVLRLKGLGIPSAFQAIVISAIEHGTAPSGGSDQGETKAFGPIVTKVINAAYDAFRAGVDLALLASGCAMFAAALIAALTLRNRSHAALARPEPEMIDERI
jgi:EmrB/QacA subfamily drug resistance transporter